MEFKEDLGMKDEIFKGIGKSFSETLKITGHFVLELFGPDGILKDRREMKNTITTVGKNYTATWLSAASQAGYYMQYLAVGTGTPTATALGAEVGTRVAGTITNPSSAVWQNAGTFAAGNGTGALIEIGIFSAAAAGTMLASQTFAVVNKLAGDSLALTWQITVSS